MFIKKLKILIASIIAICLMTTLSAINGLCLDKSTQNIAYEIYNEQIDVDFNCDGNIDWADVLYILNYYTSMSIEEDISIIDSFSYIIDMDSKNYMNRVESYMMTKYEYTIDESSKAYVFKLELNENIISKLTNNADVNDDGRIDASDTLPIVISIFMNYEKGDVNYDFVIDASDSSEVLKYYADKSTGKLIDNYDDVCMQTIGDMNNDGRVDASDASDVLAEYAKRATN